MCDSYGRFNSRRLRQVTNQIRIDVNLFDRVPNFLTNLFVQLQVLLSDHYNHLSINHRPTCVSRPCLTQPKRSMPSRPSRLRQLLTNDQRTSCLPGNRHRVPVVHMLIPVKLCVTRDIRGKPQYLLLCYSTFELR